MTHTKWGYMGLVVLLVILGILFFTAGHLHAPIAPGVVALGQPQTVTTMLQKQQFWTGVATPSPIAPVSSQSPYEVALTRYSATSIHFSATCSATPTTLKIPVGTHVLFDNASDVEQDITINQEKFIVSPHNYIVTNFPTPRMIRIDCDNRKNVSAVIVQ